MPGNMLRTRKKDANLKPNRVLDKRGSRGMLYENEELRIRTIHINDEVEKGHNDIKKLKKENEHLKREIWNLRDEYEKLEDMMQRMCATYGNPEGSPPDSGTNVQLENPLASNSTQKFRFKNYRRESEATTSMSMFDSEEEEMEDMMMIDEDVNSCDSSSVIGLAAFTSTGESPENDQHYFCAHASPEDDSSLDNVTMDGTPSSSKTSLYQPTSHHHLWQHLTSVPPDLEVVKEESENTSNSNNQSPLPKSTTPPNSNGGIGSPMRVSESQHTRNSNCVNLNEQKQPLTSAPTSPSMESLSNPFFNPKIEITPAGSPTPSTSRTETGTPSDAEQSSPGSSRNPSAPVQNLGCVTLVPKKFQVTSQLRISDGQQPDSETSNNQYAAEQEDDENLGSNNSTEFLSKQQPIAPSYNPRFLQNPNSSKRRGSQVVFLTGKGGPEEIHCGTLSFPNASGLLAQPLSPFYQSEPSLSLSNNVTNSSPEVYLSFEDCENGFDRGSRRRRSSCCSATMIANTIPNVHSPQSFRSNPNYLPVELSDSVERYVVIGYIELGNSDSLNPSTTSGPSTSVKCNYELRDLRAQEIIDELENQFDSALEQIVGVRVMVAPVKRNSRGSSGQIQIFISLINSTAVKTLVDKGLYLTSFKIHVNLIDVTTKSSVVTLTGLPSSLSNSTIISALNQFGQVVGPLERLSYKGVDISERIARMHLVNRPPSIVNIAGYQILAKTTVTADCQESVQTLVNVVQGTSVTHTPSVTQRHQQLSNSISLDQIPRVNQRGQSPNPTCQDETVRMRLMAGTTGPSIRPSSPTPSTRTNLSLNAVSAPIPTPQSQLRGCHRLVSRAVSSAPRLESGSGGSGGNPLAKRRMSTWSENSEAETLQRSGQLHSSQEVVDPSATCRNATPNSKKPLLRLLRSTPGSLVPPDSTSTQCISGASGGGVATKSFYRSMSFDPRRNSNASRCYGLTVTGEPTTGSGGFGMTTEQQQGNPSGNPRPLQSQMSHQSQLESRRNMSMGFSNGKRHDHDDPQKSLPWCGCWGNGCI